jgi:hypothetical protein
MQLLKLLLFQGLFLILVLQCATQFLFTILLRGREMNIWTLGTLESDLWQVLPDQCTSGFALVFLRHL